MIAAFVIFAIVVASVVGWLEWRGKPTRIAQRRLEAEIAELRSRMAALRLHDSGFQVEQEGVVRERWIRSQMDSIPVDAMDIPGTGPATFSVLRDSGITYLRHLSALRRADVKIATIGPKKRSELLGAYDRMMSKLVRDANAMNYAALDAVSNGRLSTVLANHRAEVIQRMRDVARIETQLSVLEARRSRLLGHS